MLTILLPSSWASLGDDHLYTMFLVFLFDLHRSTC